MKALTKTKLIKTLQEDLIPYKKYYLMNDGAELHIGEL